MLDKINQERAEIKSFLSGLQDRLRTVLKQAIEDQLARDVDKWLYRVAHERRKSVKRISQAQCQRCGSHQAKDFRRNGHRKRQLVTDMGVVDFWLPRVVCQCGGSVQIPFSIIEPYQQIWVDIEIQVERWANLGLSLRQMQAELAHQCHTQVGLRKLNDLVNQYQPATHIELSSIPPVVMLDAIWITLLQTSDQTQKDKRGRIRPIKVGRKVCVLVALGLYPQSQRWGILGWDVADSESQEAWEALLLSLEARGVYRQQGLELLIHDGGKGLIAALNFIYPTIPHQRCAFHKLRNLWHSIQAPDDLSRDDKRQFKRDILQQAQAIFYADNQPEAQNIQQQLVQQFQHTQSKFVETLKRDWTETIAFFKVLKRFPDWRRTALRTTSLLERVNRMLRRFFRAKGAFHSEYGLYACVNRVLSPKRLI